MGLLKNLCRCLPFCTALKKNVARVDRYNAEAEEINGRAGAMQDKARRAMVNSRAAASRALKRLDEKRRAVMGHPLSRFASAFGKIKNFSYSELEKTQSVRSLKIEKREFIEMQKNSWVQELLVVFNGGNLIAMAKENLENAKSNMAVARSQAAKMRFATKVYSAIGDRAQLFVGLIACACEMFYPQLERVEEIVRKCADYHRMDEADQKELCFATTTVQLIRRLLSAPIVSEKGRVDPKSEEIAEAVEGKLAFKA